MAFNRRTLRLREAVARALILFLLAAGSCLMVLGLKHHGSMLVIAGVLIVGACLSILLAIERASWIERLVAVVGGFRYRWAESKYRGKQAEAAMAGAAASLSERLSDLERLRLHERLDALEQAEAWRSQQEWVELRDVWRLLILDPQTPEELRASCREWLAKYPEALDFTARRLEQVGLLQAKDLASDENWERRERHKWRVQ